MCVVAGCNVPVFSEKCHIDLVGVTPSIIGCHPRCVCGMIKRERAGTHMPCHKAVERSQNAKKQRIYLKKARKEEFGNARGEGLGDGFHAAFFPRLGFGRGAMCVHIRQRGGEVGEVGEDFQG